MKNTKTLLRIATLGAVGYVLMLLEFSILPAASFLKLNLSDIPALLAAFAMGPVAGLLVVLIENILHIAVSFSGGVGELANILIGGTFAVSAGLLYKKHHTKRGALLALLFGSILMIFAALLSNRFLLLPMYLPYGSAEVFGKMLLSAILPFNVLKAVIITTLLMLLYKPLSPLLKK